jgi:hypothetical protein
MKHTFRSLIYLRPLQACFANNRGINQGSEGLESVSHSQVAIKRSSYIEVFKDKTVEQVGIGIPQVTEVDVLLDRGSL